MQYYIKPMPKRFDFAWSFTLQCDVKEPKKRFELYQYYKCAYEFRKWLSYQLDCHAELIADEISLFYLARRFQRYGFVNEETEALVAYGDLFSYQLSNLKL